MTTTTPFCNYETRTWPDGNCEISLFVKVTIYRKTRAEIIEHTYSNPPLLFRLWAVIVIRNSLCFCMGIFQGFFGYSVLNGKTFVCTLHSSSTLINIELRLVVRTRLSWALLTMCLLIFNCSFLFVCMCVCRERVRGGPVHTPILVYRASHQQSNINIQLESGDDI